VLVTIGEAAQEHVGPRVRRLDAGSSDEARSLALPAHARSSFEETAIARQRPPSAQELDAGSQERHRRRSLAARAAAETGGMASLVAALMSNGCHVAIAGAV
jgi:hypothetical protein